MRSVRADGSGSDAGGGGERCPADHHRQVVGVQSLFEENSDGKKGIQVGLSRLHCNTEEMNLN